jgi:hypothetical protein
MVRCHTLTMIDYGVSLSVKQCRNFGITTTECLEWLIEEGGFSRYRLMSYWDELEPTPGVYDFHELDIQMELISRHKGTVTLCLGARQPRWPENHWPEWAWNLPKTDRSEALLRFSRKVIERYKDNPVIVSYQLENEALLGGFGTRSEIDRQRLRDEFNLIKQLDPTRPIIMSTSNSWGIPLRRPIGDVVGFSYYQIIYNKKKKGYTTAYQKPWLHRLRSLLIRVLLNRNCFVHELQLEPWGPKNIWEMPYDEQMKSMSPEQISRNLRLAQKTGLSPIDLWGGEWWYWCYKEHDNRAMIDSVLRAINQ